MGTRSTIAYKEGNKIRGVYVHWDGYLSHNGHILQNFYQEARKIGQLIELGDMSSLGAQLGAVPINSVLNVTTGDTVNRYRLTVC